MPVISELKAAYAKIYASMEKDGKSSLGTAEDLGKGTAGVSVFNVLFLFKKKKGFESVEITSWHLTPPPLSALYLIYNPTIYLQTKALNETIWNHLKCSISIDLI